MVRVNRRVFLKASLGAGASLVLGACLSGCESTQETAPTLAPTAPSALAPTAQPTAAAMATPAATATAVPAATASFTPDMFLRIDNNEIITVIVSRSEMGQGVRTSLPMIVAEELDADWALVRVEQALAKEQYGRMQTGGSFSIRSMWDTLRHTGAAARAMLIAAAAQTWGVDPQELTTESGAVLHRASDRRLSYGQLAEAAAQQPIPEQVALKNPANFRLIGTPQGQRDIAQIVSGSATYGLDVRVPGMLYAVIARSDVFGGRVLNYDATPALAVSGVRHVVEIDNGVAVVADTSWAAMQGRAALRVNWDTGSNAQLSSADVRQSLRQSLPASQSEAPQPGGTLDAVYEIPYYAHATMEPMNCTAHVRADSCELWVPTQVPQNAQSEAMRITGLPAESVTVHTTLMGTGLGRRLASDYVVEAVQVAKAVGQPVQTMWTREDDMQHDLYHPASAHYLRANIDPAAEIQVQSANASRIGSAIPTGWWRAVENFPQGFIRDSFTDELAAALGRDPYELRMERQTSAEHRAVIDLAAKQAGWGSPLPAGQGRGIAFYAYDERRAGDGTYVAQVVDVTVAANGSVRVNRVVCAVDCGIAINPDMIRAQIEGGIIFAITAALLGEITVESGRTQQRNFSDYPLLRINQVPSIEVYIVPSTRAPQGIGEMGVPPLAPALANAIFNATGKRIRRLPIRSADLI